MTNSLLTAKGEKKYRTASQYFIDEKGEPKMITLKDRLSHLTYREVCKLLGPEGERLIRQGGKYNFNIRDPVTWGDDFFRFNLVLKRTRSPGSSLGFSGMTYKKAALPPESRKENDQYCVDFQTAYHH